MKCFSLGFWLSPQGFAVAEAAGSEDTETESTAAQASQGAGRSHWELLIPPVEMLKGSWRPGK